MDIIEEKRRRLGEIRDGCFGEGSGRAHRKRKGAIDL